MKNVVATILISLMWATRGLLAIWLPAWWLWNILISPIFGLPTLTLLQSTGLLIYVWLAAKGAAKFTIELKGDSVWLKGV